MQEALQNAIKYSRARTVTVDLRGGPDALALTISDDGVGFDVDAAGAKGWASSAWANASTRSGARFDHSVEAWRGTRLAISVPLAVEPATESNPARQAG